MMWKTLPDTYTGNWRSEISALMKNTEETNNTNPQNV